MPAALHVAAFTPGLLVPSSRFRVRQYIPVLQREAIKVDEFTATFGAYPPPRKWLRPAWAAASILSRIPAVGNSRAYDLVLLQRELISTYCTLERFTGRPRVLDVDDAIWEHRRGMFASKLAASVDAVICGNQYIADAFSKWNSAVVILPTAVDTVRFKPSRQTVDGLTVTIGWTGGSGGMDDLYSVQRSLAAVMDRHRHVRLCVMADARPSFSHLDSTRVDFVRWDPSVETATIGRFDIGIMPLRDTPWNRGKCSYKMLLYMASGVSSVASPVGMNHELLQHRPAIGLSSTTSSDWFDALDLLVSNPALRASCSAAGRALAERKYSVPIIAGRLARELKRMAA